MKIRTVGDIRKALEGRKDDEPAFAQVEANDGSAWNMELEINPAFLGRVVTLKHKDLETLPGGPGK